MSALLVGALVVIALLACGSVPDAGTRSAVHAPAPRAQDGGVPSDTWDRSGSTYNPGALIPLVTP